MLAMREWSVRHAGLLERAYARFAGLLPRLAPLARTIGPARLERPVRVVERAVKGFLFDCRMCGDCALSRNGMACPMNCPKQVRNGPCGGVRADGTCEADRSMRCVGLQGVRGATQMAAASLPAAPSRPADHARSGTSTWMPVITGSEDAPAAAGAVGVRSSGSRLEALLAAGTFVVTAELSPPDSADPAHLLARTEPFRDCVDALNVTDASGAHCHLSSLAACVLLARAGFEPVLQMNCRDRNRIAIQGDLLGAAALGLSNVLCLTGDHVGNGDHAGAKHVGDLDSLTLLATARRLRDQGAFLSGRKLAAAPRLFLGAADHPSDPRPEMRLARLRRKVAAGAQFVQTQYCFDVDALASYMCRVREEGLDAQVAILIGVGVLASAKTARWIRANVPGVHVPDAIVARLDAASDPREEGRRLCIELVRAARAIPGVAGVHIMAHRQEALVRSIVDESGVREGRRDRRGVVTMA